MKSDVLSLVHNVRKKLPRLGTRKIHHLITRQLQSQGIKCGRDKLFAYLREADLLIKSKRRYIQTTNSKHWLRKYPNIIQNIDLEGPEEVWVSDITYLKTQEYTCYLTLITDQYSRKVVGYNVSKSMSAEDCVKALKMAVSTRLYPSKSIIHHSDRGLQYCSKEYVETARAANIRMSMTETSSPYDNALAERMNRTFKEEFNLYYRTKDLSELQMLVKQSVSLYNQYRPHLALNYNTPENVHKKSPTLR